MSLLTMIQRVAPAFGLPKPNQVVGNTDGNIIQLLEIAQEEGEDLSQRLPWTALLKQSLNNLIATASQGDINGTYITDEDFDYILSDSFWDRTTSLPIPGPLSPEAWQQLQAFPLTGPYFQFRIQGGELLIDPAPGTSLDQVAFEYKTSRWCETDSGTGLELWTSDTDVGRLPEKIMIQGIKWRWLERKGLEYAQMFDIYERQVANFGLRDGGKPRLRLDGVRNRRVPGVWVPQTFSNLS